MTSSKKKASSHLLFCTDKDCTSVFPNKSNGAVLTIARSLLAFKARIYPQNIRQGENTICPEAEGRQNS